MATTLVTIVLGFNVVLLIIFFIVKIHRHTVDKIKETLADDVADDEDKKD